MLVHTTFLHLQYHCCPPIKTLIFYCLLHVAFVFCSCIIHVHTIMLADLQCSQVSNVYFVAIILSSIHWDSGSVHLQSHAVPRLRFCPDSLVHNIFACRIATRSHVNVHCNARIEALSFPVMHCNTHANHLYALPVSTRYMQKYCEPGFNFHVQKQWAGWIMLLC